jgi:alpha-galactosidase
MSVRAFTGDDHQQERNLVRSGERWSSPGVEITLHDSADRIDVLVSSPAEPLQRIHIRWPLRFSPEVKILGDAWERSYGELEWLPIQPERILPWYCLVASGSTTRGFGVMAGADSLAFWQVDREGISLWLDTRNGGNGVSLGERQLHAASIVTITTRAPVSTFETARQLCRRMAGSIAVPGERGGMNVRTMIGTNDWYYAYGKNKPENILRDAEFARELAPSAVRPFTVIDDGYQDHRTFPDMAALAQQIGKVGTVPGLWIRPLRAPETTAKNLLLPTERWGWRVNRQSTLAYDPTIPEANAAALAVVSEATGWGYRLLKHDFTTFEMLGMWGNEMGPSPTTGHWHFHDRTRTNAEIITGFYKDLRRTAGNDTVIQGCNTIGHLSVGLFDTSRIGDDVSGREWERTRRCGVNTLPFRLPQLGAFFCVDPDIVPITEQVPWSFTRQWLHLVASTGTTLLISATQSALGVEQKAAVREAFALCTERGTASGSESVPLDWMETAAPTRWSGETQPYHWDDPQGATPFEASAQPGSMMVVA